MGVEEILIGFVVSVVASRFIYIITKDKNITQNHSGTGDNVGRDKIETHIHNQKEDPKKS